MVKHLTISGLQLLLKHCAQINMCLVFHLLCSVCLWAYLLGCHHSPLVCVLRVELRASQLHHVTKLMHLYSLLAVGLSFLFSQRLRRRRGDEVTEAILTIVLATSALFLKGKLLPVL